MSIDADTAMRLQLYSLFLDAVPEDQIGLLIDALLRAGL